MGNPFGEVGDQVKMNARGDGLINAAGPVDPEVFALSIQTDSGRPIALLANYGTHYVGGYRRGHVSADYFGLFRKSGNLDWGSLDETESGRAGLPAFCSHDDKRDKWRRASRGPFRA